MLIWLANPWMFTAIVIDGRAVGASIPSGSGDPRITRPLSTFYVSMVTYTSLGFDDLVPSGEWRTLAAVQAGNGVINFGWTTALIFYFIQQIYRKGQCRGENRHV